MSPDQDLIIKEVSRKITSTLDISKALIDTRNYLKDWMPLDEITLFRFDPENMHVYLVLGVTSDGIQGERDQLLFMLDEDKRQEAKEKIRQEAEQPDVIVRADIEEAGIRERLTELGVPESSDVLALFYPALQGGLVVTSHKADAYQAEHIRLFEQLREPFEIALTNALKYTQVKQIRDNLADDNSLFREATVRLTGESDIGTAFLETLRYLRRSIPLDHIVLTTVNPETVDQRILLRVSEQGAIAEEKELLFVDTELESEEIRKQLMEDLPETFVMHIEEEELSKSLKQEERAEKLSQLGFNPDSVIIVLGVKAVEAAVLFIIENKEEYLQRHLEILRMLKEPFVIALHNAIRFYELERIKNRLMEDNRELQRDMQREVGDRVIGMHQGLGNVMSLVSQVARTPSPVLLLGETGSGKEVIATAIHRISDRSTGPLISLNCGAIPESLLDSELFGHERGAFTGANERKRGRFERADKGTLFLDEVGELPPSAQVKLLRVLQEKEFERVGGNQTIRANVRLIAATNRDLPSMVQLGQFREDLWFRLNVFPIEIPPLRDRREDIPSLAYFFIETKSRQLNLPYRPSLPPEELARLGAYDWPGNVRELQNAIERALILSRGTPLSFPYLETTPPGNSATAAPDRELPAAEKPGIPTFDEAVATYLRRLLRATGGRIAGPRGAAKLAGLNPSTLRSKIKKLGISAPEIPDYGS